MARGGNCEILDAVALVSAAALGAKVAVRGLGGVSAADLAWTAGLAILCAATRR